MNRLLVALVAGILVGAAPAVLITRAVYQRATLKAQLENTELRASLIASRLHVRETNDKLNAVLLEERDEDQARIDTIADRLDGLSRGLSLCANKSDVRVTVTPTGTIETSRDGELRDLAEVVRDFANACAVGRDRDAIDHNKLIDWFERLPKEIEAK